MLEGFFFASLLGYSFSLRTIIGSWGGFCFGRVFTWYIWFKLSCHTFDLDDVDKNNFSNLFVFYDHFKGNPISRRCPREWSLLLPLILCHKWLYSSSTSDYVSELADLGGTISHLSPWVIHGPCSTKRVWFLPEKVEVVSGGGRRFLPFPILILKFLCVARDRYDPCIS